MVSMPTWLWGVFGAAILILVGLLAWALKTIIGRTQEDIAEAKNNQCPSHQESFRRVHEEREKFASELFREIKSLNENISDLKLVTKGLAMSIQNVTEKHDDNKVAITKLDNDNKVAIAKLHEDNKAIIAKLDNRIALIEKTVHDIEIRA